MDLSALGALELLTVFRALSTREAINVVQFAHAAKERDGDRAKTADFDALATFADFGHLYREGASKKRTRHELELTKGEYRRLRKAFRVTIAVDQAANARALRQG